MSKRDNATKAIAALALVFLWAAVIAAACGLAALAGVAWAVITLG